MHCYRENKTTCMFVVALENNAWTSAVFSEPLLCAYVLILWALTGHLEWAAWPSS